MKLKLRSIALHLIMFPLRELTRTKRVYRVTMTILTLIIVSQVAVLIWVFAR